MTQYTWTWSCNVENQDKVFVTTLRIPTAAAASMMARLIWVACLLSMLHGASAQDIAPANTTATASDGTEVGIFDSHGGYVARYPVSPLKNGTSIPVWISCCGRMPVNHTDKAQRMMASVETSQSALLRTNSAYKRTALWSCPAIPSAALSNHRMSSKPQSSAMLQPYYYTRQRAARAP